MTKLENKIRIAIREADDSKGKKKTLKLPIGGPDEINMEQAKEDNPQYDKIQILLKPGNIYNNAAIMELLWGSSDATNRSEFGKRLNQSNEDGSNHYFSEKEIAGIASILQNPGGSSGTVSDGAEKHDGGEDYIDNYGTNR